MRQSLDFRISGHENVLSEHKTTLEFISGSSLTKRGDCILGVSADKDLSMLKDLPSAKHKVTLSYGRIIDSFSAYKNPGFSSSDQLVIRKSRHLDARTGMILSNKASVDIDRRLVNLLKDPTKTVDVSIQPSRIKDLVFDFDDTLEVWSENEKIADSVMVDHVLPDLSPKRSLPPSHEKVVNELGRAKGRFIRKRWHPKFYGRDVWLKDALKALGFSASDEVVKEAVKRYWETIQSLISPFPGTIETLRSLKGMGYRLFMLSDSDGDRELKMRRIKRLGMLGLFNGIYTSDDTGYNKPHPECFKRFFSDTGIDPHESAFIGDHPEADHIGAKPFGMTTVLLLQGPYAEMSRKKTYGYVDFSLDSVKDLPKLLRCLDKGDMGPLV